MRANPKANSRSIIENWLEELLRLLAESGEALPRARVAAAGNGMACLVQVWPMRTQMPTAKGDRLVPGSRRKQCREDVVAVVSTAGHPLTRKEIIRALKDMKAGHGVGTIAKALAELTASGELVNTRDRRGYRQLSWVRRQPSLFGDLASVN
jgi:hypothetical protein